MNSNQKDNRKKNIGKVTLDYSVYSGKDLYCDGEIEDELLRIARDCSPVEFRKIIEESKNWPILYHLSDIRENIVRWLPIKKTDKVLEVGAGCGAITGALTLMAGEVTSCDLSSKRSMINAYRHQDDENLTIHVGNFMDVEKSLPSDYDYICLIGVLEYGQCYIDSATPYEDFLMMLRKHLSSNGRIIIAIENRFGLKYFAGCREDHTGSFFGGLEGYSPKDGVKTFTNSELTKTLRNAGFEKMHFYYPYPDYKLMHTLYSDKRLPQVGELSDNRRNFDRDRLLLFDEKKVFDTIIRDNRFQEFSNSFLVILGDDVPIDYARFSNDRDSKYAICTKIISEGECKVVTKNALHKDGFSHIENLFAYYNGLNKRYQDGKLRINKCRLVKNDLGEPIAVFEYLKGCTLAEKLDSCLMKDDMESFLKLLAKYVEFVGYNEEASISDKDVIFANIIIDEKDEWSLIDYEWTEKTNLSARETAFRAIYCYMLENESRNKVDLDAVLALLQITPEQAEEMRADERFFQKTVTGRNKSLPEIRDLIGNKIYDPKETIQKFEDNSHAYHLQVYEGDREGNFSEENSYFVEDAYLSESEANVSIKISADIKKLRIDPLMESCIVKVHECMLNHISVPVGDKKCLMINGRRAGDDVYIFSSADPNMVFDFSNFTMNSENNFEMRLTITRVPAETAEQMIRHIKRIF